MQRRPLASAREVAEYLGVPMKTLYNWRYQGTGPRFIRVGGALKARWEDVDKWLDANASDGDKAA